MTEPREFDDIVIGAGIAGLAHAYHLGRMGRRVLVVERNATAMGASIRNFGMIWPIGQPDGKMHDLAMRSRGIWLTVLSESRLWHEESGSFHLAYHQDEMAVLEEFASGERDFARRLITPDEILRRSAAVEPAGLLGALWSPTEVCVDPREVAAGLPGFLSATYGTRFRFGLPVTACRETTIVTSEGEWKAERIWVCTGDDLRTLFAPELANEGLVHCKLQMMRTQAYGDSFRIGPMLAAGLTLAHYSAFRRCQALPELKLRLEREMGEYVRYGIHVMASQNGSGEITIGDSHEYGDAAGPFDNSGIDRLILDYLGSFLRLPNLEITSRWHGVYVKHESKPYTVLDPMPGVTIVTGLGGAGMTLSFGVAEDVVRERV